MLAVYSNQIKTETPGEEQSSGEGEGQNSSGDVGEKESSENQVSLGDAAEFIDAFQELGYSMNEDEISTQLASRS